MVYKWEGIQIMKRYIKDKIQSILDKRLKGIVIVNWDGSDLIITVFCANLENRLYYRRAIQDISDGKTINDIANDIIKIYKRELYKLFFKC